MAALLLLQAFSIAAGQQEVFGRRACKFRPLPENLAEGYATPGGFAVSETYGVPLAVLLGAGHELKAEASDSLLGFSVQTSAQTPVQLQVEAVVGQRSLKCTHTFGAGGHMKQCRLSRIQLQGPLLLRFRGMGQGQALQTQGPSACVTLRLDLEISSHQASEAARRCSTTEAVPAAPPLLSVSGTGEASVPLGSYSSPAPDGVIWKSMLPAAAASSFNRLYARLSFPSAVHPIRMLIEELQPWASLGTEPRCARRCFSGTPSPGGQVLQRLLPPVLPFALWILADDHDGSGIAGGHCANYDFELSMSPVPLDKLTQDFLGPPALLCEGGAWPERLEQGVGTAAPMVLRQQRFRLRDTFDLTGLGKMGGLHALEIQVTEPSIFRLTTHAPTVPARPMLVQGRQEQAWLALGKPGSEIITRRIPAAGREFRHSISTELEAGEYTLLFVVEMPIGGLRPCAMILLSLLLEPLTAVPSGTCSSDAGNGILDLQAMAEPLPLSDWRPTALSFQVTLPRPVGHFEEGAGDAQGLQIIARSSMNLGYSAEASAPPVLLVASVTSPFNIGDLQITFYENGQPLGEPEPLPSDTYRALAGPVLKDAFYEVVLLHVPRSPSSRSSCVDFQVQLAAVSLSPPVQGHSLLPLPGAETCWLAPKLPSTVHVREGETTLLEADYQFASSHSVQVLAAESLILRVVVSSSDADVRVGQEPLQLQGLSEDRYFYTGPAQAFHLSARALRGVCPKLRMHLVAVPLAACWQCIPDSLQALGLEKALVETAGELRKVSAWLAAQPSEALTVPLRVQSASSELRIEFSLEAPWLPLDLVLLREGQEEKPWARGRHVGQRLTMLLPSIPQGNYKLKLGFWGAIPSGRPCAAVLGTVALMATKGRDTSNYRQEMLDLPELLAVLAPPKQLVPGWFERSPVELLGSEIYAIPAGGTSSVELKLPRAAVLRLVAEPADILAPRLLLEMSGGTTGSATGAGLSMRLDAGVHSLTFRNVDEASASDRIPFFVTYGLTIEETASSCEGLSRITDLGEGQTGPSWRWKRQLNVRGLSNSLKLPLTVAQPSVATIAAWSSFIQHYIRVALVTEEGLWVGEQRSRRSSLEIELPVGSYQMIVEEMSPLSPAPAGCTAMGVEVSLVPFSSVERVPGVALGASLGLGAKCDGLGALPLPLDVISDTGGSAIYGGPVQEGRLLLRERVMLTDIHDGRKKVFLRLPPASMLRAAVVSGDAEETEVVLEDSEHRLITAAESHIMGTGQAASYMLEAGGALWLSFHREHREAAAAGCASFDLLLQAAPMQDIVKMSSCGSEPRDLQSLALAAQLVSGSNVGSAEGRVTLPGGTSSSAVLRLLLREASVVEFEAQFNFMLSNVHLWLDGSTSSPAVQGRGVAGSVRNAMATLRLSLEEGEHTLKIRHDPAFPKEGGPIKLALALGQCAPLALKLRKLSRRSERPLAVGAAVPLAAGSDVVLQLDRKGLEPTLGGLAPNAAGGTGPFTVAWSFQAIQHLLGNEGRLVTAENGRIWALPVRFRGGDGELWFRLDHLGRPWSGEQGPVLSAPLAFWPEEPEHRTKGVAPTAPVALAPAATSVGWSRLFAWLAVLGLIAYYVHSKPLWFKSLVLRAGLWEPPTRFTQFQVSEMTNPSSWPRVPRERGAYGTLD